MKAFARVILKAEIIKGEREFTKQGVGIKNLVLQSEEQLIKELNEINKNHWRESQERAEEWEKKRTGNAEAFLRTRWYEEGNTFCILLARIIKLQRSPNKILSVWDEGRCCYQG